MYVAHCTKTYLSSTDYMLFRRYFINDRSLQDHFRTKVHKRRLKALELEPYSIEESERASGKGNFVQAKKRTIETIATEDDINKDAKMRVDE